MPATTSATKRSFPRSNAYVYTKDPYGPPAKYARRESYGYPPAPPRHPRGGGPSRRGPPPSRPSAGYGEPTRGAKKMSVAKCPFCENYCGDMLKCGYATPFYVRMRAWQRYGLCPDKTCFKAHLDPCRKASSAQCACCGGNHHKLCCERYAQEEGRL